MTYSSAETILLISPGDKAQEERLRRLEAAGLFKLIFYDYKYLANAPSSTVLRRKVIEYFSGLFSAKGYALCDAKEIYVSNSGAYCLFELYLIISNLYYRLVEFSADEFSTRRLLNSISQYSEISVFYQEMVFTCGAVVGNNPCCVQHIYCPASVQDITLPGQAGVLDIAWTLSVLPAAKKSAIISSYPELESLPVSQLSTLLLPNSESLTRRAIAQSHGYWRELIAPYTLLADLMGLDGPFAIKPHPHGSFPFENFFPDSVILHKTFPIEFLNLFPLCRIDRLVSVETSAVWKIAGLVERSIALSRSFLLHLDWMLRLFFACLLPLSLEQKRVCLAVSDAAGLANVTEQFSQWAGVPLERQLKVIDPSEQSGCDRVVLAFTPETLCWSSGPIHRFVITRSRIHGRPCPFSEGREYLYATAMMEKAQFCSCEQTHLLKYSGLKVQIRYEGEDQLC